MCRSEDLMGYSMAQDAQIRPRVRLRNVLIAFGLTAALVIADGYYWAGGFDEKPEVLKKPQTEKPEVK